ncbi:MAG: ABC transporter permease [Anaerolineae bacterium]|nr:ABC transporter permease [Anaerolineae bacterium]
MRSFGQLYLASLREWWRDSTAMLWSMAFPVVIALAIGVIFSSGGKIFFRLGVVNEAGDAGQPIVDSFKQNDAFQISEGSRQDELDALEEGRREGVVIISAETGAALSHHTLPVSDPADQVPLAVHIDPNATNTQAVLNMVQQTLIAIDARLTGTLPLLSIQTESASAHHLRSADYMLPGVLALSLLLLGLYVTAMPLVSLREKEVLRRMGSTPLDRRTLLAAQVAFRLTVALIQSVVIICISIVVFDLPLVAANLPAVTGMVLLGAAAFITLGYFLSTLAKTEEAVQVVIGLTFLLFVFLSGVLVPLWRIPGYVRPVVDIIPLTYLADALRQLMVDANPDHSLTTDVLVLVAWLAACTILALRFFRWEPQS